MSQATTSIILNTSAILQVPVQTYDKDFTFVVNGTEINTSRLTSELLSPKISRMHASDPTIDRIELTTTHRGNFSHILKLANFEKNEIPTDDLPFAQEVLELLGNESIDIEHSDMNEELTTDNIFAHLRQHEQYRNFYATEISKEIEFASSHFFELVESHEESVKELELDTLLEIVSHEELRLKTEDQLLKFVTDLYVEDSSYSILYEQVLFCNVSAEMIHYFVCNFEIDDITKSTWNGLCERLDGKKEEKELESSRRGKTNRYTEKVSRRNCETIEYNGHNEFKGIFNHLRTQTGEIENSVNFTGNTYSDDDSYQPRNVALFEKESKYFNSKNESNSWICFEFKEHRVVPTHYTIKSRDGGVNWHHPKSWIIEGSNDNNAWTTIDEENNKSELNGVRAVHTFAMNHPSSTEFKYIRMRSTGPNWHGDNYLIFNSFEI